jgi:dTDP-glucose 4,6-dehydratase
MRLNDGRVIPAFIGQLCVSEDLTIFWRRYANASFVMSMIRWKVYLDCCIQTMCINNILVIRRNYNQRFCGWNYKVDRHKSKVVYFPLPINDPLQRQPDITKARELLGWEAKVNRAWDDDYFRSMSKKSFLEEHKDFSVYNLMILLQVLKY